ncbi:MAG: ABC transporter ATP-binding protein [Deltaproteobacteria bacterium]|nr:ABC transporter ATP-binding protein [Deltaproteobacteria bacterium]
MLRVDNLAKKLGDFEISNVSFDVGEGDYFALLGASGVGKSILLEALAGIMPPDSGHLFLDEKEITYEKIQKRRLVLVHQNQSLFPHLTVRQNIAYGLKCLGRTREVMRGKIGQLAEAVAIEGLLDRYPPTLSGGEAQRVALARSLAIEPRCLLLDEPLSALDNHSRHELRALLREVNRQGYTIIHVTHDFEETISLANRIAVMEKGSIAQVGSPQEIFHHPKSEFVAQFIGIKNFFHGRLNGTECAEKATLRTGNFTTGDLNLLVYTDQPPGLGHVCIGSDEIVISTGKPSSSARNIFAGVIKDISNTRSGIEVIVDIGREVAVVITPESLVSMGLSYGDRVWIEFKATAVKFFPK